MSTMHTDHAGLPEQRGQPCYRRMPLGIKAASLVPGAEELTPWMWGMNGATSVLASILAIVVAMSAGITVSFWTGFVCYLIAATGLYWVTRTQLPEAS